VTPRIIMNAEQLIEHGVRIADSLSQIPQFREDIVLYLLFGLPGFVYPHVLQNHGSCAIHGTEVIGRVDLNNLPDSSSATSSTQSRELGNAAKGFIVPCRFVRLLNAVYVTEHSFCACGVHPTLHGRVVTKLFLGAENKGEKNSNKLARVLLCLESEIRTRSR
jgi:hypothetical protein